MKTAKLILFTSLFCFTASHSSGAVISINNELNATGAATTRLFNITDISGEESVYFIGTMTFDTVDTSSSFFVFEGYGSDAGGTSGQIFQWGKEFTGSNFSLLAPNAGVLTTVANTSTVTLALKLNQLTGAYTYFLNPNFSLTEASNTGVSGTGASTATIGSLQYRWGNSTTGVTDYTGFAAYTGSDTPFAAVPEPSSALMLGVAGFALILRRRR